MIAFLVASLATFRLSRMVAEEEGPGSIFVKLRGSVDPDQETWIGRGINCTLCVSFWLALPITVTVTVLGYADGWAWPLVWWGIAGAVVILKKWVDRR